MNPVTIVLAGNFKEFLHFFQKNRGKSVYKYGGRERDMLGVEVVAIEIVGTFWERKDAAELERIARERLALSQDIKEEIL